LVCTKDRDHFSLPTTMQQNSNKKNKERRTQKGIIGYNTDRQTRK